MSKIRESKQHNYRLGDETTERLAALAAHLECSTADVIRRAVRELARRELPAKAHPKNNSEKSAQSS